MLFLNFSLKQKIFIGCAVWAAILMLSGSVIYICQKNQSHAQEQLAHSKQVMSSAHNLLEIMINLETGIRGYLLSAEESYLEPFNQNEAKFDEAFREARKIITDDKSKIDELNKIGELKQKWIEGPAVEEMMARKKLSRKMISIDEFISIFKASKGKDLTDGVRAAVSKIIDIENKQAEELNKKQTQASQLLYLSVMIGIPLSIVIGFFSILFIILSATKQIRNLAKELQLSSAEVGSISKIINSSADQLSNQSDRQSEAAVETTAAVKEISSLIKSNAQKSFEANEIVKTSLETAETGKKELSHLVSSVNDIVLSSKKIEEIISVLEEISFQTNILALNAAVEAARAGEQGKGFSVVAEAVRSLSTKATDSTKQISKLIKENVIKTTQGSQSAKKTEETIVSFLESLGKIATLSIDITATSREQSSGVNEIGIAMNQLDQLTLKNVGTSHESAKSSKILNEQYQNLNTSIENLLILIDGKK